MELLSFTHVCRLCVAREGVFIPIFEGVGQKRAISTKIKDCLPVKVSQDDQLPKKICENCLDRLESIHNYRNATIDAERELCKLLSEVKQKNASSKINTSVAKCETVKLTTEQSRSGASTPQIKKYGSLVNGVYVKYDCDSDDSRDSATSTASIQGPEPREVVVADYQEPPDDAGTEIQLPSNSNTVAVGVKQSAAPPLPPPPLLPPPQPTPSTTVTTTPQTPLQPPPLVPSAYLLSFVPIQQLAVRYSPNIMLPAVKIQQPSEDKTLVTKTEEPVNKESKNGSKLEACEFCGKHFPNAKLVIHRRIHTGERPFACSICGEAFVSKRALKAHGVKHSNERPFSCDICHRKFKRSFTLTAHKKRHFAERKFECDICGHRCTEKANLEVHRKRHFNEYKVKCDICDKGFYTNSELRLHLEWHKGDRTNSCTVCNSTFPTRNQLKEHAKTHRPGYVPPVIEKHYCKMCGKCFPSEKSLVRHEKLHAGESRILCPICGKVLCSADYMKVHMRTHTGEKPVKCDICGKAFICKRYLSTHIRTHTGERPYQCSTCGKTFTQASSLGVHKKTNPQCSVSQFVCHCGEAFDSNDLLAAHRKTHSESFKLQ